MCATSQIAIFWRTPVHPSNSCPLPPLGPCDVHIHSPAPALATDEPRAPIQDGHIGAVALGHLDRIGLTPMAAIEAPGQLTNSYLDLGETQLPRAFSIVTAAKIADDPAYNSGAELSWLARRIPRRGKEMSIIGWIILGLVAGFIASKIVNKEGKGFFLDIILGIIGAIVGGWLFAFFGKAGVTGFNLYSMVVAIVGAIVVLVVYHAIRRVV